MTDDFMTESLIYKDKLIRGNDVEITFHKDYVWIYNDKPLPVVKFILTNCINLTSIKFDSIDYYNDGVIVDIRQENNRSVFETTDMGDVKVKIVCDKVVKEEREYNSEDFIDLIKEILNQRDSEHDTTTMFSKRADDLKHFLNRELDITDRKIKQADWLTEEKKHFLEGQKSILQKVIETIAKREKEDFQNRLKNQNSEQTTDET